MLNITVCICHLLCSRTRLPLHCMRRKGKKILSEVRDGPAPGAPHQRFRSLAAYPFGCCHDCPTRGGLVSAAQTRGHTRLHRASCSDSTTYLTEPKRQGSGLGRKNIRTRSRGPKCRRNVALRCIGSIIFHVMIVPQRRSM